MPRPVPKPSPPAGEPPLRFAHPFFTSVPVEARAELAGVGRRMSDWAAAQLGPIPRPRSEAPVPLASILGDPGVAEIVANGEIRFHAVGDTGRPQGGVAQEHVAADMALDYHPDAAGANPAFFLHLGDVIYGPHKDNLYRDEFYRPYKNYPGKILAVAGNHDGETFPGTDDRPLGAFLDNLCAPTAQVPPIASGAGVFRQTMTLPGVYWLLDAPFVQVLALYSNTADGPGFLSGPGGDASQTDWLTRTLKAIQASRATSARKALLVAVHHPPYSNGGHAGSPAVLIALDKACNDAGVMPDAVLSGHSHNYQRHTRRLSFLGAPREIPFLVAGCGGHNNLPVDPAYGQMIGDRTYDRSFRGYGYLVVRVSASRLVIETWKVPSTALIPFDSVSVDLATGRLA